LQRKRITRNNGVSTEFRYDFEGRTVEIKHSNPQDNILTLQYLYDAAGNMRQKIEVGQDLQNTQSFNYDSLLRVFETTSSPNAALVNISILAPPNVLIQDPIPNHQAVVDQLITAVNVPVRTYVYDVVGNRTSATFDGNITNYQVNELDQYFRVDTAEHEYDENGNLIEDESFLYRYDHRNQLSLTEEKSSGEQVRWFHDYFGRRSVQRAGTDTRVLLYDSYNLLEEYHNDVLELSVLSDTFPDSFIICSKNGSEFYLLPDLTKSVRYIFNGNQKHNFYSYDEFGNLENSLIAVDDNPFRFGGKRLLLQSNKYDFVFRTYDPSTGRFFQRDPYGFIDGTNMYSFVGNNPLIYTDTFGVNRSESNSIPFRPTILPPPVVTAPNPLPPVPKIDLPQAPPGTNFAAAERAGRANLRILIPHGPGEQAQHYLKWRNGRDVNLDPTITNNPRYMGPLQSLNRLSNGPYVIDGRTYNNPHKYADRGLYPYYERTVGPKVSRWGTDRVVHVNVGRRVQRDMTGSSGPRPPYIIGPTIKGIAGGIIQGVSQNFVPYYAEAELATYTGAHFAWSQGWLGVGNALEFISTRALPVVGAFVGGYMIGSWINEETGWSHSLSDRAIRNRGVYQDLGLGDTTSTILGGAANIPILSEVGEGIGRGAGFLTKKGIAAKDEIVKRLTSDDYTMNPFDTELWSDFKSLF
ncbi:MAG TPA: RHS repeat-associated core domain-containing protein, partial [Pyrinomonadaceae bacterium]